MTTTSPRKPGRLGHYAFGIRAAVLLLAAAAVLLLPHELSNLIVWALLVPFFWSLFASVRHDRALCQHCVDGWPLDGSDQAERTSAFRLFHRRSRIMLVVAAAAVVAAAVSEPYTLLPNLATALVYVWCAVDLVAERRHNQLLPWCPWCRDNGGGHDDCDCVPEPDPAGTGTKGGV